MTAEFRPVLLLEELPRGTMRKVTVNFKELVIVHVDAGVFAMNALCAHARGPIWEGTLEGCLVTCPWHNWQFDVRTGVSPGGGRAVTYPVRVADGQIFVDAGPPGTPRIPRDLPPDM